MFPILFEANVFPDTHIAYLSFIDEGDMFFFIESRLEIMPPSIIFHRVIELRKYFFDFWKKMIHYGYTDPEMWCGEKSWTHSEKHIQRDFCLPLLEKSPAFAGDFSRLIVTRENTYEIVGRSEDVVVSSRATIARVSEDGGIIYFS